MLVIGLGIIGIIFQLLFIHVEKKEEMKKALLLKMVAASLFVTAGFIALQECADKRFGIFIVLLFGADDYCVQPYVLCELRNCCTCEALNKDVRKNKKVVCVAESFYQSIFFLT